MATKITTPVKGAPFPPSQAVRVVGVCDETGYPRLVGLCGRVVYLNYDCGCGQTHPGDPMIGVLFASGRTYEFWREELEALR